MARIDPLSHPVARHRARHKWSQAELARRAEMPRTSLSAIEGRRLTPSVSAALSLARALGCSVEELFGQGGRNVAGTGAHWAWDPGRKPCRYWEAEVGGNLRRFPVEADALNLCGHDGLWRGGAAYSDGADQAKKTLVAASCDPAAGLLAAEYGRASGFRLLVFPRGGKAALDLLKGGLIHVAALHYASTENPELNRDMVRAQLGKGYRLLRAAEWQEGIVLPARDGTRSVTSLLRQKQRWALRETGSAARECLDSLGKGRRLSGRLVRGHRAVAQSVGAGWATAGVCVRLVAEESGLRFLPVRTELLDYCFAESLTHDPRLQAFIRVLRSQAHRRLISDLPGYDARGTGELLDI